MPLWGFSGQASKVMVKFDLELVLVKTGSVKTGGEVLLRIPWGYWFTKDQHELLE